MEGPSDGQSRPRWIRVGAVILGLFLVGGLAGFFLGPRLENSLSPTTEAQVIATPDPTPTVAVVRDGDKNNDNGNEEAHPRSGVYERVAPAVVRVHVVERVTRTVPSGIRLFLLGEGSGLVWDDQGHIVTNYHIVEQAAQVETIFHDGTVVPAEVVATDADSDLAVLRVDVPADRLRPLTAGDSDTVSVGQRAIAIGNPFGHRWTLTTGEISALNQTVPSSMSPFSIPDTFLLFAGIHPHNAGGPLLDQEGRVIGVSALIRAPAFDSPGFAFVIPINLVTQLVPVLIEEGIYRYAWLGIVGRDMSPEIATAMGLPQDVAGALVTVVAEDGPADQAGLRGSETTITVDGSEVGIGGDVIVEIDDQRILGMDDLIVYLVKQTRPGQVVTLTLLRDDQVGTREVTLGERPR